ncbi:MAG: hypothetical protein H6942_14235 [Candidatus Accumulibacter sp.]|nr:hypothetical protein [Accumulibacter sp.]MCP5249671.1 hypothetical protein [Accumulibacter sp.]
MRAHSIDLPCQRRQAFAQRPPGGRHAAQAGEGQQAFAHDLSDRDAFGGGNTLRQTLDLNIVDHDGHAVLPLPSSMILSSGE